MKSIKEIYKIGKGPSSSHTMGPERAANYFKNLYPQADSFQVILYGSLCKTLSPLPAEIIFSKDELPQSHPNTFDFIAFQKGQNNWRIACRIHRWR